MPERHEDSFDEEPGVSHADPDPAGPGGTAPAQDDAPAQTCPPFDVRRFRRELALDQALRGLTIALLIGAAMWLILSPDRSLASQLALLGVVAIWIVLTGRSARMAAELPHLSELIEVQPEDAETRLAQMLQRRLVPRWVRLSLYHRLAQRRQMQGRMTEVAAICAAVLEASTPATRGPMQSARPQLLLMLTDAYLNLGWSSHAYGPLSQLHQTPLKLMQWLQLLSLQTRYELALGQTQAVVYRLGHKVELAELMPLPHAGTMHAMLAAAAQDQGLLTQAAWLRRRARLLGGTSRVTRPSPASADHLSPAPM